MAWMRSALICRWMIWRRHASACRRFATDNGPDTPLFALLAGDALRLPFADATFDAVICSEVLEHIPDYRAALVEIQRVLKPGGYFCASVPRAWCERICWWLSREYHQTPGGHLRIFRAASLRAEIEERGFRCYKEHGAHALHTVYWWLQCLFWKTRERNWLVRQYHRLLVWDMMRKPALTGAVERALNPVLGKSVVMYFRKVARRERPLFHAPGCSPGIFSRRRSRRSATCSCQAARFPGPG
jgi:SAM-dependent methyltransferase